MIVETTSHDVKHNATQHRTGTIGAHTVRAWLKYPAEFHRIQRGAELAMTGQVTLHQDGTATVVSLDGRRTYHVNGSCPCQDAQFNAPGRRCKHRWARSLARLAGAEQVPSWAAVACYRRHPEDEATQTLPGVAYGPENAPVYWFMPADGRVAGTWLPAEAVLLEMR